MTEDLPVAVQPVTWLDILTDETVTFDDRLDRWEALWRIFRSRSAR